MTVQTSSSGTVVAVIAVATTPAGDQPFITRTSQEGILIGGDGRILKEIGSRARQRLEALLGTGVCLDPWVKTRRDWRNHEASLRALGYFSTPD